MSIYIPIHPKPSPRPRFRVMGRNVSTYMPKDYTDHKKALGEYLTKSALDSLWDWHELDRYALSATFIVKRPKMHWRTNGELKPRYATLLPAPRQDIDNFVKTVMDAATLTGHIWKDDNRVVRLQAATLYECDVIDPCIMLHISKVVDGETGAIYLNDNDVMRM